jgi:hypothetical protein
MLVPLFKASSYTDQVCIAAPLGAQEKRVPVRALKEATVKVIGDTNPTQTSEKLMESINAMHSSKANKVLAAGKLKSRDILVNLDSYEIKNLIEQEDKWTRVIASRTNVTGRHFRVMTHTVRTNRV